MKQLTRRGLITPPHGTGDCNDDNLVTVDELIRGVNIALGNVPLAECPSFDTDGNDEVTIDELLKAVNNAVNGLPTHTPTPTSVPATATASPTPTTTPTPTSTQLPSRTATPTPSLTSTPSATPTASDTVTATATPTFTVQPSSTPTPSATPTSSATQSPTPTPSETATPEPTSSATESPSSTPSATATASPSPTRSPPPTASPTITATPSLRFCSTLSTPAVIPDNDSEGVGTVITIPANQTIADLNVLLEIRHTWVGDLRATLEHVGTGTAVTLLDRPGIPGLDTGCNRDDISATLDDQAGRSVQDECEAATPTIAGRLRPPETLSAFGGQNIGGMWRLVVSDNAENDTGALLEWCLEVNALPSPPPFVSDFTCNGGTACTLAFNQSFFLGFRFMDSDGNASAWRIIAERDDGQRSSLAKNSIVPPAASGAIPLSFAGFACLQGDCPTATYDFFLVVSDATGAESVPVSVHVVLLGS